MPTGPVHGCDPVLMSVTIIPLKRSVLIIDGLAYLSSKIGVGERLEDDRNARIESSLMDNGILRVAGREEDLQPVGALHGRRVGDHSCRQEARHP